MFESLCAAAMQLCRKTRCASTGASAAGIAGLRMKRDRDNRLVRTTDMRATAAQAPEALYDRDFVAWAKGQAQALKERRVTVLDWDNLAEEIDALAKRDERSLE